MLTNVDDVFYGMPSARYEAACASGSVALDAAITKIKAQEIDMAIVVGFELMKTVDSKVCGDYLGRAAIYDKEAKGIDYPFPKLFGKLADEMITKYNLDEDITLLREPIVQMMEYIFVNKDGIKDKKLNVSSELENKVIVDDIGSKIGSYWGE